MRRRFLAAFVVSLGLCSVLAYAIEEETLAGPALMFEKEIEKPGEFGVCPPNFPIQVFVKEHEADKNGDHVVCTDEHGKRFVDNDYAEDVLEGPRSATGHGNFFDSGKAKMQDISFSFVALNTGKGSKDFSDDAKGQFEYHDQTGDGPDLTVHGEVLCLSAEGNSARMIGRITNSNDIALPVDSLVMWRTEDNGEGGAGTGELLGVDRVSRLSPLGIDMIDEELPKFSCRIKFPELPPIRAIVSGNIQVQ
jgi:hypothetical protein